MYPTFSDVPRSKGHTEQTRLHQFARSLLYNATAGGALWWLRKTRIVNYAKHRQSPFARRRHDFRQAAARRFKLHFPHIVWWKFHENPFSRSRERLSHSFGGRKKNICTTYMHPPPTGRRLRKWAIKQHTSWQIGQQCWVDSRAQSDSVEFLPFSPPSRL